MITVKNKIKYFIMTICVVLNIQCQTKQDNTVKQSLKVDFDFAGRRLKEVHDPTYKSWVINEGKEDEKSFDDVSIKLKGDFTSKWFKLGVSAPHYAQLVSDGLFSKAPLEMTISGLKPGKHSLITFHNTFDKIGDKKYAPIDIFVNDKLIKTVLQSNRVFAKIASETAYLEFEAKENKPVIIRFEINSKSNSEIAEMLVNGFEIDTPDLKRQTNTPFPENGDEHVVVNEGLELKWASPKGTSSYHLYFGEHKNKVINANKDTEEFKGELTKNTFSVSDLYSMKRYFWRADAIDNEGNITKGNLWFFKPAQIAFPGAEGYGRFAIGGRGGKVIEVTNLNDDGPGSFRDAVNQEIGPKTIIFNVSGNIELKSRLVINQPYTTIAGQTAPGEGITITRAPVGLTGDDGIARFLRVRIGAGKTYDGMGLTGANHSIIDHCSISWTIDESFSSRGAHNITLQRTLISEALNVAGHGKYESGKMHGYAATIGGDIGSFHHNLLAHNYGRNWSMGGGLNGDGYYSGRLDIRNNVVYNWGHRTTDGGANEVNFVNNYFKPGGASDIFVALTADHEGVGKGSQRYFFEGNVMPGYFDENNQEKGRKSKVRKNAIVEYETFLEKPFFPSYVNTQSAKEAYKSVLSDVGATQPFFDKHDYRIVNETLKGTYTFKGKKSNLPGMIDTEKDTGGFPNYVSKTRNKNWDTDHDGLPNWWENQFNLNPNSKENDFSDSNLDDDKNGYTQLEEYLHWMAQPHFFINENDMLDLHLVNYFKGFEKQPKYSFSNVKNGKVSVKENTLQFKAISTGMCSFEIKVIDAEGHTMVRTINVFVK